MRSLLAVTVCAALVWAIPARSQQPCGAAEEAAPRIDATTPIATLEEGAEVCVCGAFPTAEAVQGLRIDGRPVQARADSFGRVVWLRLPPGLAPGVHTLSGAPEAGYSPEDQAQIQLVSLQARWCPRLLSAPRSRRACFTIQGSDERLPLRVRNQDPQILILNGGPVVEVETSGGRRNEAVARGRWTGVSGEASLVAELDRPSCPCAGGGADGVGPATVAELQACLATAVAEIAAWFDRSARELASRAAREALSVTEVITLLDELEGRMLEALAAPELAALRAWVEDELAREREGWRRSSADLAPRALLAAFGHEPAGHATASFVTPTSGLLAQGATAQDFGAFWERMRAQFFGRLDQVSGDLEVNLCVRADSRRDSKPDREARLWLYPKRYPLGRRVATPDALIEGLTRGIYCLIVTQRGVSDREFDSRISGGQCIEATRPGLERDKIDWAEEEVNLVAEAGGSYTCDLGTHACVRDEVRPGFECRRGVR